MKNVPELFAVRLRQAAVLLMSLPTVVAAACFAHGHGSLGSTALLLVLAACVAAGAVGSYRVLELIRTPRRTAVAHSASTSSTSSIA